MSKTAVAVLCCAVGAAGAVVGALGALRFGASMADSAVLTRAEADLAVNSRALEHMQSGEGDRAAELLQIQLDGALVTIDSFAPGGAQLMPKTYARLERVRRIRDSSGYRPSDANVASAVDRALALSRGAHP